MAQKVSIKRTVKTRVRKASPSAQYKKCPRCNGLGKVKKG